MSKQLKSIVLAQVVVASAGLLFSFSAYLRAGNVSPFSDTEKITRGWIEVVEKEMSGKLPARRVSDLLDYSTATENLLIQTKTMARGTARTFLIVSTAYLLFSLFSLTKLRKD